jgi:hypothetical protein
MTATMANSLIFIENQGVFGLEKEKSANFAG